MHKVQIMDIECVKSVNSQERAPNSRPCGGAEERKSGEAVKCLHSFGCERSMSREHGRSSGRWSIPGAASCV